MQDGSYVSIPRGMLDEIHRLIERPAIDYRLVLRFLPGGAQHSLDHALQVWPLAVGISCRTNSSAKFNDQIDTVGECCLQI